MNSTWTIAAVQMDCTLNAHEANRQTIFANLREAAGRRARLVIFPECAVTGYGMASRAEVLAAGEPVPGPTTESLTSVCRELNVFAIVGLVERHGDKVYNAAALVGPAGLIACYRKVHLPFVGLDRFVDRGDRPFAVHDLGGLRVGIGICFDGSFPESSRILALAGADLIALPTNWSKYGRKMADLVCRVRALENHIYFAAVNRVGDESGFHYIGHSGILDFNGEFLSRAEHDRPEILSAEIDPVAARDKKLILLPGEYEIDRMGWRRPDLYGPLVES